MIGNSLGLNALNSYGEVLVRSTLQMVDHPSIFALGDIANTGQQKSARKTGKQCKTVANNIKTILAKGHNMDVSNGFLYRLISFFAPVLLPYPGCIEILPLSNGKVRIFVISSCGFINWLIKRGGTSWFGILGGITFGDSFTRRTASEDLYMSAVKRKMNL